MRRFIRGLDPMEVKAGLFVLAIIAVFVAVYAYAYANGYEDPSNRKYDFMSGSQTWTDSEGRRLIQGPDGSVRELSPR